MKKLLIFMLVLGWASTASAALTLKIDGETVTGVVDVNQSVHTIQILSDDTTNWLGYVIIEEGGAGVLSNAYTYATEAAPDGGSAGASGSNLPYSESGWGVGYEMTTLQSMAPTDVVAGTQHTVDLDATLLPESSTGLISLWDDRIGYDEAVDSISFHVIPEPATIVLLGLGGLLLRRRK